jgi:hypothetical protein
MSKLPMVWEEYNYLYFPKDKDWKWSVAIISITIALISFMFSNITFGMLILIATVVLLIHAFKEPHVIRFEINTKGVRVNQEFWSFSDIRSFWIEDNREHHIHSRILFSTNGLLDSLLVISLPLNVTNDQIHDIHEELVKILPEERMNESIFQKALEYLGF